MKTKKIKKNKKVNLDSYVYIEQEIDRPLPKEAEFVTVMPGENKTFTQPYFQKYETPMGNTGERYLGMQQFTRQLPSKVIYKIRQKYANKYDKEEKITKKNLDELNKMIELKQKELGEIKSKIENYYLKSNQNKIIRMFLKGNK